MTRAGLDKRPQDVAEMFDAVAGRYDVMNAVMTGGQERRWRGLVRDALAAGPDDVVLDLAAGTGASTAALDCRAVACDFSTGMLAEGRRRHPAVTFVAGDALALPFRDGAFDAVTVSFGLRNVADLDAALREMARVSRPGARLVVLETAQPPRPLLRRLNRVYVERALPALARLLSSDAAAYAYLAESTAAWPEQSELAERIRGAGWGEVGWRDVLFGSVALHVARRRGIEPARAAGAPAP